MAADVTTSRASLLSTRRLLASIGAVCVVLSSVTGLSAAVHAQAAEATTVLDRHNADVISVGYEDDELVLRTRADLDSGAAQVLDPGHVLFHVTDELGGVIPDTSEFAFLGEAGAPIWTIPQAGRPGALAAGWETEALPHGVFADETVRIRLHDIAGPGRVELYLNEPEGPLRLLSSSDAALRTVAANVGARTRADWVFTAAGVYTLTFIAEAERVSGGTVRSAPQSYSFLVGDASPLPEASPVPTPSETPPLIPADSAGHEPDTALRGESQTAPAPDPTASEPALEQAEDPTVVPAEPLPSPDPATLTEEARGAVTVSVPTVAPGGQLTVAVPAAHASHWVAPWLLSEPTDLGWKQVNAEGAFTIAVPEGAVVGAHRVVVRDRTATLIGWTEVEVVAAEQAIEECVPTPVTTTVRPENVDVVTSGHFDFGPVKEGGTLRALVKDDRSAPPQWVDPGTLVFHLTDAAAAQAPGGNFAFLGSGQVWQIPLTQQPGVPWLGWNTQHPSVAGKAQGPVTLTLDGLEGPGELAVYSMNSWGELGARYFGTVADFPRSTSIEVGTSGVHVHGIWAFTQPGTYHAELTFAGTIDGERVSATSPLTFFVGEGDPRSAVQERTVTTYVGRTADGAECRLTLAVTGPADAQFTADLAGLAGASMIVGLAFLGAAALAPRRRARSVRTS